ncbi:MAG: S1C family serine protease [Actinomycetota bacterium]
MRRRLVLPLVALLVLLGACDVRVLTEDGDGGGGGGQGASVGEVTIRQSDEAPPHSSISGMVARVLPSVVNVRVTSLDLNIFGGRQETQGQGSGVIIDPNGIILTNNHVVRDALKVRVVFNDPDRKPLEGEVIGAVPERDLAVIKVPARGLPAVTLGHSGELELGDGVVAMGFPLGLGGPTVTQGIISGTNRDIQVDSGSGPIELRGLLQTDAAINPGNSGGALVDLNGRLVGINTAAAQAFSAENIGFAIEIDEALPVIRRIIEAPERELAWLGVQVAPEDPVIRDQLNVPAGLEGALVVGVIPDTPAEEADIRPYTESGIGDVIVAIDDHEIASGDDLTDTLLRYQPGDDVRMTLVRDDEERTITVELAKRPATFGTPDE